MTPASQWVTSIHLSTMGKIKWTFSINTPVRTTITCRSTWAVESQMSCSLWRWEDQIFLYHHLYASPSFPGDPDFKKTSSFSHPWQKKPVSSLHTTIINISVQRLTAQAWFIFTHVHIWIGSLSKTIIMVPPGFQTPLSSREASAVKTAWMIFWSRGVHICAWLAQQ